MPIAEALTSTTSKDPFSLLGSDFTLAVRHTLNSFQIACLNRRFLQTESNTNGTTERSTYIYKIPPNKGVNMTSLDLARRMLFIKLSLLFNYFKNPLLFHLIWND